MDDFEVIQAINDVGLEVRNFKKHRNKDSWQFSCEVCGDSQVNRRKARFGIAKKDNAWVCHCFNCGYSNSLFGYLKDFHPSIYSRISVKSFESQQPLMYDLNHLIEGSVDSDTLTKIFFINKFSNNRYWLDYLVKKKITLKQDNIRKLYKMHKDYWHERNLG